MERPTATNGRTDGPAGARIDPTRPSRQCEADGHMTRRPRRHWHARARHRSRPAEALRTTTSPWRAQTPQCAPCRPHRAARTEPNRCLSVVHIKRASPGRHLDAQARTSSGARRQHTHCAVTRQCHRAHTSCPWLPLSTSSPRSASAQRCSEQGRWRRRGEQHSRWWKRRRRHSAAGRRTPTRRSSSTSRRS